jgi:hypothetical protein
MREEADDERDTFISIGVQAALVISKLTQVEKLQDRNVEKQRGSPQQERDKNADIDDQHERSTSRKSVKESRRAPTAR